MSWVAVTWNSTTVKSSKIGRHGRGSVFCAGFTRSFTVRSVRTLDLPFRASTSNSGRVWAILGEHLPDCITTDLFPNPWLDRVENAYQLSFSDSSVGHLILFDVWHHLEHPANALAEFRRVLVPRGRVIILEPAMSVVGRLVYGNCHHEPLGFNTPLSDQLADLNVPDSTRYFAAQSSSHRIFVRRELPGLLDGWEIRTIRPITSFAYLGSGGFRGPQLYPQAFYQLVKLVDGILGLAPSLFAARLLVCISKKP